MCVNKVSLRLLERKNADGGTTQNNSAMNCSSQNDEKEFKEIPSGKNLTVHFCFGLSANIKDNRSMVQEDEFSRNFKQTNPG